MTEEEAKRKWCFRFSDGDNGPRRKIEKKINPNDAFYTTTFIYACIGSDCMAWRLNQAAFDDASERWHDAHNIGGITHFCPEPSILDYGYCGLAGPT